MDAASLAGASAATCLSPNPARHGARISQSRGNSEAEPVRVGARVRIWLPLAICELAIRILPESRKSWGQAMEAELSYIHDDREGLGHAFGCLAAAARERACNFETRFAAGLWAIALVSVAFAVLHLYCASRGIQVLLGSPDGFLDGLRRTGSVDAELVANYHRAMPLVIACFAGLGLAHIATAYFLVCGELRLAFTAWCAALSAAALAVAIQLSVIWNADGLPSEFWALLFQALSISMLKLWSNGRHSMKGRT